MDRSSLPPLSCLLPFEAAARLGSFTRAADELHLTQSAVSRQIRVLERSLGQRLFERRNRAVFLTEAGEVFAESVTRGLKGIADSAAALQAQAGGDEVVLSVELYLAVYWLMPRLADFHRRFPAIQLRIAAGSLPLADRSEPFDLALQCAGRASGDHRAIHSAPETIYPVCAPSYLEGRGRLTLQDLGHLDLLHYEDRPGEWMDWASWFRHQGVEPPANHAKGALYDSYPVMIQAAVAGHGVALGWGRGLNALLEAGQLVPVVPQRAYLERGIVVYRSRQARETGNSERLLVWLKEQLDELEGQEQSSAA